MKTKQELKEIANLVNSMPEFLNRESASFNIEILRRETERAAQSGKYEKSIQIKTDHLQFMEDFLNEIRAEGFVIKTSPTINGYIDLNVSWK